MIDETTKTPLKVLSDEIAGPYMWIRESQLEEVTTRLDRHGVWYWVDSMSVSVDHEPASTVVNFGRNGKAAEIQRIMDEDQACTTPDSK